MKRINLYILPLLLVLGLPGRRRNPSPMIVHEWGTITTRHAPNGTPEGRLNRISPTEVLPQFVHRFEPKPTGSGSSTSCRASGRITSCRSRFPCPTN